MVGISAGGDPGDRWPLHGDRRAADGAVGVGAQPGVDARSVEVVVAGAQLLHLLTFPERRQTHRALSLHLLPELLHFRRRDSRLGEHCGARISGEAPAAAAPEGGNRGGALYGEDEGVDEGGDGDDSDEAEDELERG